MIDRTQMLAVKLTLLNGLKKHPAARLLLRDGTNTTVATLVQGDAWTYRDNADGSVTVEIVETGEATRARLLSTASFGLYKNDTEAPFVWANGTREQWTEASRRVWRMKNYKPSHPLPIAVADYNPSATQTATPFATV